MRPVVHSNLLLRHMEGEVLDRLRLKAVSLPARLQLETVGEAIRDLYFLETGIGTMTTCFENGMRVETSMFGYESVIGVSALMGVRHSFNQIAMLLSGTAYQCSVADATAEFQRGGRFQQLTLGYVQAQLTIATQVSGCNATHHYEQRLARWLLICSDRANSDTLAMAQEYVSEMLGSTRSTVSLAAARLKAKGLIDYTRGSIVLQDKKGLEAEACECYRVVRNHLENILDFDRGFAGNR